MSDLYTLTIPTLRRYVTQIGVVLDGYRQVIEHSLIFSK